MQNACNASTPRTGKRTPRETMYWWSEEIADLRRVSIRARREWSRTKRRGPANITTEKQAAYRLAKKKLGSAIRGAKTKAWNDLLLSIDEDPWGLPYRLVLGRLRKSGLGMTETLDIRTLYDLLDSLFPPGLELSRINWAARWGREWSSEWDITPEEVDKAIREKYLANTAPGWSSGFVLEADPGHNVS